VAPGAVVTEGTVIPPHSIVAGVPARVIKTRDCTRENRMNAFAYHRNAEAYRRGEHRAWEGEDYQRFLAERLAEIERG
jgi:carbonic anhydrase/acetyltransferase-like protein (isoleucine patch superfamily)